MSHSGGQNQKVVPRDELPLRGTSRDDYIALRRPYQPESVRLMIVAESPPASGRYFLRSNGRS
jgi:hypothetical protein